MKKFLKVFSSLCLVLVVGAAVLLSGCAKKFNVNVQATAGGEIYKVGDQSVSLKGDNEVEQGKTFQFAINADQGYYIAKVTVNGKVVDISSWTAADDGYVVYHKYAISDVQADAKIVVTFAAKIKQVTFKFVDSDYAALGVADVKYNVPCHKTFDLFKMDDADIFFTKTPTGAYLVASSFSLKGASGEIYVKTTADKVTSIIQKLDSEVLTDIAGCSKVA